VYLELEQVSKRIKGDTVLDNISISMQRGKIYGIRGINGSGKTMLLRAICGLIHTTQGTVKIDGQVIGKDCDFPKSVGALIENPGFIETYSGYQNLKSLADIKGEIGKERIVEILELVGLDPLNKKKVKKYSLGMKQKLGIAAALMERPDLIILDEPTNALDEQSVKNLRKLLLSEKERGALLIVASHDVGEVKLLADEMFYMENGRIKEHTIERTS